MRIFARTLCALCLLLLFLGGAFTGFERVALDPAVYDRLQAELDVYDEAGLTPEAQARVNRVMAGYLTGQLPSLDTQEEVFGVHQEVFNENEKAHMADVLALFRLERALKIACLLSGLTLMLALPLLLRRETGRAVRTGACIFAGFIALTAGSAVILWTANGFDALFLRFHHIFFSNDLWLMDPRTDAMIRMLPSDFFLRIAAESGRSALVHAACLTVGGSLFMPAAGSLLTRIGRKHTK